MNLKCRLLGMTGALILSLLAFSNTARADVLPFQWSTSGSLTGAPATVSFTDASLSAITNTDGAGDLSGINLGTFYFGNITADTDFGFDLTVNFFRPDNADDPIFSVTIHGTANTNGVNDTFNVDFPDPTVLTFNGTDGVGTFTFGIRDIIDFKNTQGASPSIDVALLGDITGATISPPTAGTVPEPSSLILVSTMLVAVGFMVGKRMARN